MRNEACMIWTPDGVWLQTYDETGARRLSGCGRMRLHQVEVFCRDRGIDLLVKTAGGAEVRPGRKLSAATSQRLGSRSSVRATVET
jgi:hypothetical protein